MMASFLDMLLSGGDYRMTAAEAGYPDRYGDGLLSRNRDRVPASVEAMQTGQDFVPGFGDALALAEAYDAASRGELAAAGLLGTGAVIGLVPGAGDAISRPVIAAGRNAMDLARRIEVDPSALGSMGGNIRLRPEATSDPSLPTPRNEAEAMAQKVLEMRAAGNAGDVTDDMMALADDQYMFNNTPLPMDEASRLARAREAGRDVNVFHGTDADVKAFDEKRFGQNDQGWYGRGVTTDTDPEIASAYANYNEAEIGQNVMPLTVRGRHMALDDNIVPASTRAEAIERTNNIKSLGYDGSSFTNDRDLWGDVEDWGTERVTFDPSNIRSRFARFDPEFRHLRNLSAGVSGLGLLSAGIPQEDQY